MHVFEFYLCYRIVYVITVILMPNKFISYKKQAQKLNDKIWKKNDLLVLRECQSQTDTQHAKRKWRGIKVGKEKCNLLDD